MDRFLTLKICKISHKWIVFIQINLNVGLLIFMVADIRGVALRRVLISEVIGAMVLIFIILDLCLRQI